MELLKKKYKKSEIQVMLDELNNKHDEELSRFKVEVGELSQKNQQISAELLALKDKERLIDTTLISANKQAEEIISNANLEAFAIKENLKLLLTKWKEYFNGLQDKYPYYPAVNQAIEFKDRLEKILNGKVDNISSKSFQKDIDVQLNMNNKTFNPKEKIEEYISATSDSGFNLDDVLNPGELHLEDLCKELGLMDEINE